MELVKLMSSIPRLYCVGNSPLSFYLAHEIAHIETQPKIPNIVLLLQDKRKLKRFLDNDSKITLNSPNGPHTQFMAACSTPNYASGRPAIINNLIIAEKNKKYISAALNKYSSSIDTETNIMLINPPVGLVNFLYDTRWPTEDVRPKLLMGITEPRIENYISRGIYQGMKKEFQVNFNLECSKLNLLISDVPKVLGTYNHELALQKMSDIQSNPLVSLLKKSEGINSSTYTYGELFIVRMERLIIESCIEPLAALYDCKVNSELLRLSSTTYTIKNLIHEQTRILKVEYPFIKHLPNSNIIFDVDRLYNVVIGQLKNIPNDKNYILKDIYRLNKTNINQLTGFFVQLAVKNKVDCRWNRMLTWLVKGKAELRKYRMLDYHYL